MRCTARRSTATASTATPQRDRNGRLWLQYWLFYYYNDFQLLGPLVSGGKHEGDWELVQIRLGPSEQPEQAVYTQHKTAESRPWADVRKAGANTPLVYVARGSHANYFRAGSHWTGVWWDQADGRGPQITPTLEVLEDRDAGLGALARLVGGHEGDSVAAGLGQPAQPGAAAALERPVRCWSRPPRRLAAATATLQPPPAPPVIARREGDRVIAEGRRPGADGRRRARVAGSSPAKTWRFSRTRRRMIETSAADESGSACGVPPPSAASRI